jgi:transcriptional regulator with XRE-family HTH domain
MALTPNEQVAKNLKRFREELGLSQQAAAALIGVAPNSYTKWEQSERAPMGAMLHKVAQAFRRPMDDFFLANPPVRTTPADLPAFALKVVDKNVDPELRQKAEEFVRNMNREHLDKVHALKKKSEPKKLEPPRKR